MVLSPFAWVVESTHRQLKAENSLFPSAKRIWTPLSEHAPVTTLRGRAAQPAQKLTSNSEVHRDAVREALPPFPPSPELCTVTRQLCPRDTRSLQERHRPGWLRLLWGELLSVSPAISLQIHTQRGILSSRLQSQAVPFPNKWNESDRKGWRKSSCFQKRGLELRSPSFPQAGDRNGAPAWRRRPSPGGGIPTFWLLLQQTPSLLVRNRKSQPERLQHLIPEARLDSSFTILFIFSNQWEKWTSSTWKLAQFYLIGTSFCFATLILHVPKLKCFISSYRQLFI